MKIRNLPLVTTLVLSAALLVLASGCAWSVGGSSSRTQATDSNPTRGQELMDLKKAHDEGAISDEEYERLRRCMMDI